MKKIIFSLILISLCLLSYSAFAEDELFNYSFYAENEAEDWSGCFFDNTLPFGDGFSSFVTNPFGEVKNGTITHVLDYSDKVYLEAGQIYTLRGYVMNPLDDLSRTIHTNATLESGANTIIVTISGANSEWCEFTTTFYSGQSGDFNLSLHFTDGSEDFGFFVDELVLEKKVCTLSSLSVSGSSEIMIPINRVSEISYSPALIASDSTKIVILSASSIVTSCSQADGVEYNPSTFTLSVYPEAIPGTKIELDFTLENYKELTPHTLFITLTDNMIDDSAFDGDTLNWESSARIDIVQTDDERYVSVPTNDYGSYGYYTTITYNSSQLLLGGELYVLRAKVKSDIDISERAIYTKNTSRLDENTVFFEVKDVSGGQWKEVFAAFIPDASGVYDISINLYSAYDANIFIDDITLTSETLKPEYITLHAPGNIAIPDVATAYPIYANLRDQLGNVIYDNNITVSLEQEDSSIFLSPELNALTVFPDTLQGEYTLVATYNNDPSITATLPITISFDYIGDGSFEKTVPNEWWTVTSPYESTLYFRNDGYSKRALIVSEGEYFILLNNSYVHLIENTPYVFNSEFSSAKSCTVTLFIEALDSTVYPLAQFYIPEGTTLGEKLSPELFLAEQSVVGRLFLYIQSDSAEPFSVYADNISLKKASVIASNPHVTGTLYVSGTAEAQFSFYNSVMQDNDTSSCVVNWYVSPEANGQFTMLEAFDKNIYFDTTFYNKYVYFEVIPVCPVTGFSGDAVRSPVYRITPENFNDNPSDAFTVPVLEKGDKKVSFSDIKGHWAEKNITELASNGIVNGVNSDTFAPDRYITRAEFATLLSNAFSIKKSDDFSQFTDISKSDWYYNSICALNQNGIINGITYDKFIPMMNISREDAVVMIMRIYDKIDSVTSVTGLEFHDAEEISTYAYNHVQKAYSIDIITGTPSGNFFPKSNITRAEAAAIVYRMIKEL